MSKIGEIEGISEMQVLSLMIEPDMRTREQEYRGGL